MARAQASGEEKIDLYKLHKADYAAPRSPRILEIGPAKYLAISGRGTPGSEEFHARVGALYSMAFTIKMTRKFAGRGDYKVCSLEGLWWVDGCAGDFSGVAKEDWNWQLLIRTPEFIKPADVKKARTELTRKGKCALVREVGLETVAEGSCVQMLHVGPYDEERETIEKMRALAQRQGMIFYGKHHEIYLSDPRRVPPERLRTILRMPVRPAGD